MTAEEMAQAVQYTVDQDGKVTAVVVAPSLWKRILDELEDVEDRTLVRDLRDRVSTHPQTWALSWGDVADQWRSPIPSTWLTQYMARGVSCPALSAHGC